MKIQRVLFQCFLCLQNIESRIQGRLDASVLTETGQNTARQVGEALQSLKFDAIYSSPLQRAKQTTEIIHS